nr:A/G-specific adenine glycosylase [Kineosphaera limosa]
MHEPVCRWYAEHGRDLPWRHPDVTPWGVLVCEVMAQQTPVSRVDPAWRAWLARWPTPAALAADSPGEAVRMWDRLGYPRRALRLHAAATAITLDHGGQVPADVEVLLTLPGIGTYTANAVAAFAYGRRSVVVDTNVRRVLARAVSGAALPAPALTAAETRLAAALVPAQPEPAARWNIAVMELGALVCTARSPACERCPIRAQCAWQRAGAPPHTGPARRGQAWAGTDRQVRGALMAVLRGASAPVGRTDLLAAWPQESDRASRCLDSLVRDGLAEPLEGDRFALPS